jgi:hypothetical protein
MPSNYEGLVFYGVLLNEYSIKYLGLIMPAARVLWEGAFEAFQASSIRFGRVGDGCVERQNLRTRRLSEQSAVQQ